jgi:hypothetical protein
MESPLVDVAGDRCGRRPAWLSARWRWAQKRRNPRPPAFGPAGRSRDHPLDATAPRWPITVGRSEGRPEGGPCSPLGWLPAALPGPDAVWHHPPTKGAPMSELATTHRKRRLFTRLAGFALSGAVLVTVLPACAAVTPTEPTQPAVPTTTIIRPIAPAAQVPSAAQAQGGTQTQPAAQAGTATDGSSSPASSATGSAASNLGAQEELWLSQQPTPAEIAAEPACDDSYNGCAP